MKIKVTYKEGLKKVTDNTYGNGESLKIKGEMSTKEFVELAKKIPPLAKIIVS